MRRLFVPTARQLNVIIPLGMAALGYALYLRYLVIEHSPVGLACQSGLDTWLCATRKLVIAVFEHSGFGGVALAAAVLNFLRPSMALFTLGCVAGAFGIVLYNVALASLAIAILIVSLARPASGSM